MTEQEITVKYGCGDGGCVFGHTSGQHTNGGCHCLNELPANKRVRVRGGIMALRGALKEANEKVAQKWV